MQGFILVVIYFGSSVGFIIPRYYPKLNNIGRNLWLRSNIEDEDTLGEQPGDFKSGFVSILGNPNVGKSTLMNALLGEKLCIISPKPQTTRHRILGVLTQPTYQMIFSDTPGMVEPAYMLQEAMMESVRGAIIDADIIVIVTDPYGEPLIDDRIFQKLTVTSRPILVVVNKMDLIEAPKESGLPSTSNEMISNGTTVTSLINSTTTAAATTILRRRLLNRRTSVTTNNNLSKPHPQPVVPAAAEAVMSVAPTIIAPELVFNKSLPTIRGPIASSNTRQSADYATLRTYEDLLALWRSRLPRAQLLPICAKNGTGVPELLGILLQYIPKGPKYFPSDTLTNRDERFFTTEIIRECILSSYQDEVPYSCEVVVDGFRDKSPALSVIEASIMVNRESQKLILIGKGGLKLKAVGSLARKRLEEFLDRKVFLSLRVSVDPDWRANKESLIKYGYIESDFG